jgi:hypothetical protein
MQKKLSPTSKGYHAANRDLTVFRKMYNWAIANGYVTRTSITSGMLRGNIEEKQGSRKRDFKSLAAFARFWVLQVGQSNSPVRLVDQPFAFFYDNREPSITMSYLDFALICEPDVASSNSPI